ncbi:septal ring lytic transglycosylase RlpA family protein [Candidatus Thiothrix sp. Deng01]|uniref:Endolytic peptidoglycan transglycosylase RlpA n=1 Tax=Candidatus Thiothrix phosphatis TaxID=3112415 RepID=A0ABU6CVT7_9GAMM|nr:septal ring lytic transglycosylase RlpA family protein [Candidatus Thiothrix sp. Deng01]MEB4590923.1 septal ring lytic transglycosylase RlpA family protein [Candidatus Thiothrix sp. Deng01]
MKTSGSSSLSYCVRRIGAGVIALALAATFSMPVAAAAKERTVSKTAIAKKAGKKVSKKASHAKSLLKKSRVSKKSIGNRNKARYRQTSATSTDNLSGAVWAPSQEPRQAYYEIPHSVAGQHAAPQQQIQPNQVLAMPSQTALSRQEPASIPQQKPASQPQARQAAARTDDDTPHQVGTASFYSDKFDGQRTASGERFDQGKMTCAHGSLPFGCRIRVTNLRNQKAVEVKVNDRGGFSKHGRMIDLSKAAAKEIGMVATGTAKVMIEVLD